MTLRRGFALACAAISALIVTATAPSPAESAGQLQGVDVSQYQGRIDWKAVARTQHFAIVRATLGNTYVDTYYAANRYGAHNAHVRFGAYHFAKPGTNTNDALIEADHFARTAKLRRGDLIPALDLEVTGGLGVSALQRWVRTWLARVAYRVGAKPMIYVSPSFWKTYMGNTTWFANNGYRTLWIAHWNVSAPTVPAANWGGRGWTFWQWTSCGRVTGITGCVDRDRYNGSSLSPVTIGR
jgi:GH25 family lysozyme M1 (1,4-beta-N-acetylmuramidase)